MAVNTNFDEKVLFYNCSIFTDCIIVSYTASDKLVILTSQRWLIHKNDYIAILPGAQYWQYSIIMLHANLDQLLNNC